MRWKDELSVHRILAYLETAIDIAYSLSVRSVRQGFGR